MVITKISLICFLVIIVLVICGILLIILLVISSQWYCYHDNAIIAATLSVTVCLEPCIEGMSQKVATLLCNRSDSVRREVFCCGRDTKSFVNMSIRVSFTVP